MNEIKEDCLTCAGDGYVQGITPSPPGDNRAECPTCGGRGYVWVEFLSWTDLVWKPGEPLPLLDKTQT